MDASPTLSRNISRTAWFGYSPDLTDSQVIALYTVRYGQVPKEVLRGASIVLCGPVPETLPEVSKHPPDPKSPLRPS